MKKMFFTLGLSWCLFIIGYSHALPADIQWYPGMVILNDASILKGEISYNYVHDLVMYKSEQQIQTFPAHQVHSFSYWDDKEDIMHQYKVLDYAPDQYFQRKVVFEVLLQGDVVYLRKHNRYPEVNPASTRHFALQKSANVSPHVVCYDYFVSWQGKIIKARHFSKKVLPEMIERDQKISEYIKKERLQLFNIGDQIILSEYFNNRAKNLDNMVLGLE